jgi:hypothetical protein
MINNLSEIYLSKNKDILEPFGRTYGNKCNPENRTCEEGYTWTTKYSNPDYGLCNSKCKREKRYTSWSEITGALDELKSGVIKGRGRKTYCDSSSCSDAIGTQRNVNSHVDILSDCKPGDGDCPFDPVNCVSSYGKCKEERLPGGGRKCVKKLKITKEAAHGGTACPTLKEIECPPDGDGCPYIPVDCQEGYGSCKLNKEGKCVKENIIYQNPAHGGKECVNKNIVECEDGEGSCPVDCVGKFTLCNSQCFKAYQISQPGKNGGKKCPHSNGHIANCTPGESGDCQDNKNCIGEWSRCDNNCFKRFEVSEPEKGSGSCRFKGKVLKCTKEDEFRCRKIPKDCDGKWGKCNSKCKRRWIKTKEETDGGKCDYNEQSEYDCEEGVDDCEVSLNCYGSWTECDSSCIREWKIKDPARGLNGKCEYPDGKLVRCKKGEGQCGSEDVKKEEPEIKESKTNDDISQESKDQQMILYGIIALLILIIIAVNI